MAETDQASFPTYAGSPLLPDDPPAPLRPAIDAVHVVTVEHRGNFAHATCAHCSWCGPGRRAMSSARDDAAAHLLLS